MALKMILLLSALNLMFTNYSSIVLQTTLSLSRNCTELLVNESVHCPSVSCCQSPNGDARSPTCLLLYTAAVTGPHQSFPQRARLSDSGR